MKLPVALLAAAFPGLSADLQRRVPSRRRGRDSARRDFGVGVEYRRRLCRAGLWSDTASSSASAPICCWSTPAGAGRRVAWPLPIAIVLSLVVAILIGLPGHFACAHDYSRSIETHSLPPS